MNRENFEKNLKIFTRKRRRKISVDKSVKTNTAMTSNDLVFFLVTARTPSRKKQEEIREARNVLGVILGFHLLLLMSL